MDFPGLLGAFYSVFSSRAEIETAKNVFLERIESGAGRAQFAMYRQHGLLPFSHNFDATKLVCRGLFELNNFLFDLQDDTLSVLTGAGAAQYTFGGIANDGLLASIDASTNSLFIVSAGVLYRINGAALTTPATPFVPVAVGVLSGLVICIAQGIPPAPANQFFFSTDDGQTWPALNFQTAQAYPNALLNLVIDHQELWLFGNRRTQVFVLSSDPLAPLQAVSGAVIEMGLAAKNAVVKLDNSIFWFGRNKDGDCMVWRANGYTPTRVSNHAVENTFRTYVQHEDATMAAYQINGHSCLRLTFPSANNGLGATWEYDISTGMWTECAWWDVANARYTRHRGNCYVNAFQHLIVGDYANGLLYYMGPDYYTDFGYPIRWERRTPHVTQDGKRILYKRFGVFMQGGVGLTTPIYMNDQSQSAAAVAAGLAALVAATTITQPQANALNAIYAYQSYNQSLVLPDPATIAFLGFFDYGAAPEMAMRYSNNAGNSWSPYLTRSMGRAGDFNKRIYWTRLGMSRDRVWEISGLSPVQTAIVQGSFDADVADS